MTEESRETPADSEDIRADLEPIKESLERIASETDDIEDIKQNTDLFAVLAERSAFWSGPLPSADSMAAYNDVSPDIPPAIMDDFVRTSLGVEQWQLHQIRLEDHKLEIESREQLVRIEGERSDIKFRWVSGGVLWLLAATAFGLLALAVWMFFQDQSNQGVAVILILAVLTGFLAVVVGGKGRISAVESDTQTRSLEALANIIKSAKGDSKSLDSSDDKDT